MNPHEWMIRWACCLFVTVNASICAAQAFPTKTIQVVSSASPGTSGDAGLRMMAAKMSVAMGQPVIVELRTDRKSTRLNSSHRT